MTRLFAMLIGLAALFCLIPSFGQTKSDLSDKRRHWRVMVILPETHIARPRIPDPAAETMFCKKLIDAGYKVIDQERYAALRDTELVDEIIKQGPNWQKDVHKIGSRYGADVLITGSAFTQEVSSRIVQTEAGSANSIKCRCRIELKGILVESAEKFYADSIQKTGPGDLTVELSSKACLEVGAGDLAAAQIEKLDRRLLGIKPRGDDVRAQLVELRIKNVRPESIEELEGALAKVPGVVAVDAGSFDKGDYLAELKIPQNVSAIKVAGRIAASPNLRQRKLRVVSASSSRIVLTSGQ